MCTLTGGFNIRDNKLNLTINMRSNDAILGTPTDIAFFCLLQQQALKLLREHYPDLEMGIYTHIINSYHIYEKNFKLVEEMVCSQFKPSSFLEIGQDFIDLSGNPSTPLIDLMKSLEKNLDFESDDKLFSWIYSQCKKNKKDDAKLKKQKTL